MEAPGSGRDRAGAASRGRRGFTLVEVLVALVVAGLMLPTLARAFAGAWGATRTPMDVLSGITLARDLAAGTPMPPDARARGFAAKRDDGPATLLVLPSAVAPAPRGTGEDATALKPDATPAAIRLAMPKGLGAPAEGATTRASLRHVSVTVRTPAGRSMRLDTVRLLDAPP